MYVRVTINIHLENVILRLMSIFMFYTSICKHTFLMFYMCFLVLQCKICMYVCACFFQLKNVHRCMIDVYIYVLHFFLYRHTYIHAFLMFYICFFCIYVIYVMYWFISCVFYFIEMYIFIDEFVICLFLSRHALCFIHMKPHDAGQSAANLLLNPKNESVTKNKYIQTHKCQIL